MRRGNIPHHSLFDDPGVVDNDCAMMVANSRCGQKEAGGYTARNGSRAGTAV